MIVDDIDSALGSDQGISIFIEKWQRATVIEYYSSIGYCFCHSIRI